MGMFTELFPLCRETHLTLLLSANGSNGTMTISVMPRRKNGATGAGFNDLTLTGTPAEFDSDFTQALTGYRETLLPLLAQAQAANTALEAAAEAKAKAPAKAERPASRRGERLPSQGDTSTQAPANTDSRPQPNDDPDMDWMKNRQPELF
jgi:PRTRC genetic system protein E